MSPTCPNMATAVKLQRVYQALSRDDGEGRTWYQSLSDMHFADLRVGWAVGSRQILYTENGGKEWVNQFEEYQDYSYINPHRVFAVSPKECWITAISSATNIYCCHTRDGGATWHGKEFEAGTYPNDIFFIDPKRGWLVTDNGRLPAGLGKLHFTNDGGNAWAAYWLNAGGKPYKIRFIDAKKGWLIEHYFNREGSRTLTNLYETGDGGLGWELISSFERRISDLCVLDGDVMVACGESGYIARSVDGGRNWLHQRSKSRAFINSVQFYNNEIGIAVGDSKTLLLSKDFGQTWAALSTDATRDENFVKVHFLNKAQGILISSTAISTFNLE